MPKLDGQVRNDAKDILTEVLNETQAEELLNRIPARRLRIYDESAWSEIAGHYERWHGLVEFIEGSGGMRSDPVLDGQVKDLLRKLENGLRGRRPFNWADIEDAVASAVNRVVECAHDPYRGYTFE